MNSESHELSLLKAYSSLFEKPQQHQKKVKLWSSVIILTSFIGFAVVWSLAGKEQITTQNASAVSLVIGIIIGGAAFYRYSVDQISILTKYFEPKKELIESRMRELSEESDSAKHQNPSSQ
ncbi:hypothetical protein [Persicirhabdus sediminis]|uniref:Uncharacterized protein n=1 Tax=Persicirhabdus sediminis TaxID=454144 RepID=A0A8J7MAF8_9BACT|nr:hypothetical protein [Persicirhabdus sediminis]MBK1789909.1 hypothetical protein [Persicirhabdus sediminis]